MIRTAICGAALPLSYADGSQISYPRSASTSAPWTYWNTRNQSAFAELHYDLGQGWSVKGVYTFNDISYKAKLLYAYGYPDPETGLGLTGSSGLYPSDYKQDIYDLYASEAVRIVRPQARHGVRRLHRPIERA